MLENLFGLPATIQHPDVLGYRVEIVTEKTGYGFHIAYKLHGKRDAIYRLVRNQNNPTYMFVINRFGNVCGIKGNYTFTDKDGELTPVNPL